MRELDEGGFLDAAAVEGVRAARVEAAARRRSRRVRHFARQRLGQRARAVGVRDGGDECLGVRVERHRPELCRRRRLGDQTQVHDRDVVCDVADDGEVVRDEKKPQLELARERDQEIRDLRLCRRVQRRQGLVEDDDRRARCERPCDGDALPLAPGELVRLAARRACREPNLLEELRDAGRSLRARGETEHRERVADLLADPAPRIQRGERVLEHHLQPRELVGSRAPGKRLHLPPLEADRPGERSHHADGSACERRLAAA